MSTTVKVLSAKKEVASHTIQQGEVLVLQAQDKVNYQLINDATGRGPQNILAKRDGKNLVITLDEGNTDPDIIIENYYEDDNVNNVIVGLHEDGNIYAYVPESGKTADAVSMLAEEMVKPQALGGEELSSFLWAFNPWWLAGAAAVIGGVALAAGGSSSGSKGESAPANNTGTTPTTINAPAQPVAVADPSNLTEAEKQAVKNAIKSANPNLNLTDDQIVVGNDGAVVVNVSGQAAATLTPAQVAKAANTEIAAPTVDTVTENPDGTKTITGKATPGALVQPKDEQGNPIGEPVKADEKGNYTATVPAGTTPAEVTQTVGGVESAPADVVSAPTVDTVTENPDGTKTITGKATPGALVQPKDEQGNPIGEPVTADEKGNYTATVPAGTTPAEVTQTVGGVESAPADVVSAPTVDTVTENPDGTKTITGKATPGASVQPKDEQGNPIGEPVTADENGNYTATVPAGTTPVEVTQTVGGVESAPTDVVSAPTVDTVTENPDGTKTITGKATPGASVQPKDEQGNPIGEPVTADENGNYTATVPAGTTPAEVTQTVGGVESAPAEVDTTAPEEPAAVNPPAQPVEAVDPTNLTDAEKQAVKEAIKAANPELNLTDDQITVGNDGTATVTPEGQEPTEFTPAQTVANNTEEPAAVNPPAQPVEAVDPTNLTDAEKQAVKDAIKAANPELNLTDDQITVGNDGTATVTPEGQEPTEFTPAQTVANNTEEPAAVNPPAQPVEAVDPTNLTDAEKQAVKDAIKAANPELNLTDDQITVGNDGTATVTPEGQEPTEFTPAQTVTNNTEEPAAVNPPAQPVEAVDPTNLTDAEKQAVKDAIKAANPELNLTDDQITVGNDGTATVTPEGQEPTEFTPAQTVTNNTEEPAAVNPPAQPVEAVDPTNLTDAEKQAVKDAIKAANPELNLTDDQITVGNDGTATVTPEGQEPTEFTPAQTVTNNTEEPAAVNPPAQPVEAVDPTNLTDAEKQAVKDAIKAANPELNLTDDQITVGNDGTATVTPEGQEPTEFTPAQTVTNNTEEPAAVNPPAQPVEAVDPTNLTDAEKQAVKEAIKAANPELNLTDDQITVGNDGTATVTTEGQEPTEFTPAQTVTNNTEEPAAVNPPAQPVEAVDPTNLTDAEKQAVKEAIKAANPDLGLTDDQITVGNDGTATVTPEGQEPTEFTPAQTVTNNTEEPAAVNPPAQPVEAVDPTNLTDAEKQAVKEAIKAANPELNLTDDQITVGNDGTATVTPEGQEPTEFTPAQTVTNNTEEPAAVNPPAQPVEAVDPTNLTDAEKQAVKEAIKAANPELNLTDDQITVGNDGTATVTPEGQEPTEFTPAQTVTNNTEEPAAVNPPAQPVEAVDPTNLTDAEKQAVKEAIKAANPELNLTDDQITVGNDGTATVTPEGQEPTEFTPAQTVTNNTEEPAAVNPPAQPVEAVDPTNLTDAEKQAVKDAIKAANPELNLTDDQITVGNDGTATVTPEGQEPTEFTPAQTVTNNTEEPAAVNPPAQPVEAVDPTNLTDAEKQAVKDAIKAANPDLGLTDEQIDVANDGTATVTPEGQEPTEFTPAQTVANNTEEPAAVNPPAQPVEAVDPTNLTDAEKQAVKEAIKAANPDLGLTDDQIDVANDGTAKVTPEGATEPTTFTPAQTVANNTEEPAAVNPPAQPVEAVDPTNLTDAEKQAVKDAIKAANPDLGLTDEQIDVANDGTATVTPEGQEPTEFTPAQTVANNTEEPAAVNPPAQPVEAVDPTNLTDAEKQAVKDAIKAANPELNLTDDQITVGNDGTATVTPEGQEPTEFTPAQTVTNNTEEPAAVNPPAQPVEAVDPTNLTDAEKQAVKDAIKAANPELNLTDDQITVGNDGTATVTPEGQEPTEFTPAQTVTNNTEEPAAVNPPAQPVEAVDPTNLTDAEKQAVKDAIKAANPELNLTDDQITVGNDGTATVTPEGQEPTEFTPAQTVTNNTEEPAAVNPPAQPVEAVDPTNLTDAEKQAVKDAIKAANPELNLTDDQITVGNDGTATVTPEGQEPTEFTPAQTVTNNTEEPAAVNPPAQPVEAVDPTNLTDAEKQAVKDAIKAANPELNLTDDQITVGNDGTATVTPEGQEPTEFTPAQTVTNNTEEPAAVNPPAQPVEAVDPTNLTDAEKQAVKEAIKAANPELNLTDDQITVGNDGTATVTPEGQEPTEFTPAQTVANNTEEPAAVNPPAQPVEAVDPTNLTDAEKQAVKEAIKAANPELNLTDDQITVGNDGTATVTPEGQEPTEFTPAQTVANNTEEPAAVNPPAQPVEAVDPTNLTDAEKQAVKEAIKAANPELNLTDDQITVGNDGTATVTPEGQEPTEFTPAQTVANNTEEPAAVNPPAQPVEAVDPTNLTDAEKQAVKEAIKAANPELNLTDDQITVGNDGTATVTPEGQEPTEFTPAQTVANNTEEPAAVNPPAQPVEAVDPTNLTDAEKQAVKEAIKAANPELNLTDDQITVGNDGTTTVTPEGQEPTEFTPAQTVANNTEEPAAVNPPAQPVEAVDPTNLTDAEKQAVKEAIKAANPELNLTDDQITVGNDGTATVTPEGQEPTEFTPAQTVANNTEEPAAVNPPAQPVEAVDPTNLTDAEKQAVKEAIKAANPELNLTDDQITVGNDGTATVTPEGQEPTEFTPAQTVANNTEEPAAVNPPAQPVEAVDPTNLTDAEKQAVKEAIKAANPELNLTDDQITVGNDGTATVTPEGQEPTEFTPAQTVANNTEEPAAVNPPAQPVEAVDPTNLTDAEKQAVKDAIKAANPELNLTDDQITVGNDGTATVTPEGQEPTEFTPAQTVANNTEEPAAVNPPAQPVEAVDPTNLTDAEKQAVKEAIKAANPELNLTDDQITVGNDGTATVTPEGQEPTEFTPAQTVANNTEEPAAVNPPAQPVEAVDPTNLTDAEKQAVKEAIKAANPELNLTDDQITVGNDGTATVTPEGQEPTEFTPAQTVANNTEEQPLTVENPTPVAVANPEALTPEEKDQVKAAVEAANPNLPEGTTVEVADNGQVTVTAPGKAPVTIEPAQTVSQAPAEEQPLTVENPEPVAVANPEALTPEEKDQVKAAVEAANPNLPEGTTVEVADNGQVTVTAPGKVPVTIEPAQTVSQAPAEEQPLTVENPELVAVANPEALTPEEKDQVKAAVEAANPNLPEGTTVEVADNGQVTVTAPGKAPVTIEPAQTVSQAPAEEQPEVPPPTIVDPTVTNGTSIKVTPGADNLKVVITYKDESGEFQHNETLQESKEASELRTIVIERADLNSPWTINKDESNYDNQTGNLAAGYKIENRGGTDYIVDAVGNAVKTAIILNSATGEVTLPDTEVHGGSTVTAVGSHNTLTSNTVTGNVAVDNTPASDAAMMNANRPVFKVENNELVIDVKASRNLALEWKTETGEKKYVYFHRTSPDGNQTTGVPDVNGDKGVWYEYNYFHTAGGNYKKDTDGSYVKLDEYSFTQGQGNNSRVGDLIRIPLDKLEVGSTVNVYMTNVIGNRQDVVAGSSDPIPAPTTPVDPTDAITVTPQTGGSVLITPGADNEKIVVTYYDETGSVKGVEGMAGKTHTFNEVTTDDASADGAEPVKVTVGANNQVTVTLVKQNGAWVEEGKSALPDGFSMDGDNIKIAHNSIMGDTEITVSATNSTTAAAATDTGTVLLDEPTNDARHIHFRQFGEMTPELQKEMKDWATLNNLDSSKISATDYVIDDGQAPSKTHKAYAVETANGTKYYVMKNDIWYNSDENFTQGAISNQSGEVFVGYHDTMIFSKDALGTLPAGSEVKLWSIDLDKGGNWQYQDSYTIPEPPQTPEAPKATNTVVDIAVGLDQDDTTVTTSDLTSTKALFKQGDDTVGTIQWGSDVNNAAVSLTSVPNTTAVDKDGNVTFAKLEHRNDPTSSRGTPAPFELEVVGSISVTVNGKTETLNGIPLGVLYFYETLNSGRADFPRNDDFFVFVPHNSTVKINGKQYQLSMDKMQSEKNPQDHEATRTELYGRAPRELKAVMDSVASRSDISYVRSPENKINDFDFKVKVVPLNGSTTSTTTEGSEHELPDSYEGAVPAEAGATWKSKVGGNVDVADNGNGSFTVSKAGQVLGEFSGDTNGNYSFKPAAGVKSLADNDVATTTFQFGDKHEVTFNLNAMSYDEYAALPNTKKVDSVYKVTEGDNLDFAAIGNNAEVIDLGSVSAKLSNISSAEVKAHTQGSLYIRGQADDTIDLDGWTKGAATQATTLVADNNTYDTYTSGDATLYIQQGINVV